MAYSNPELLFQFKVLIALNFSAQWGVYSQKISLALLLRHMLKILRLKPFNTSRNSATATKDFERIATSYYIVTLLY